MKSALTCFTLGMILMITGCTTNVTPPAAQNTIIERDHPVATERTVEPAHTPDVQNNIHVDR